MKHKSGLELMTLELLGIILALGLLIYLAYKGLSVIIISPLLALVAASFSPGLHPMEVFTETYMKGTVGFILSFFPIFLLGAIFGKVVEATGCSRAIGDFITTKLGKEKAILAVVLSCAVLTYGGVSLFVVVFAIYPIAAHLFREAQIPKRLLPAAIALGAFSFTMTALPGSPQIQNAIPMPYFKTDLFAAPILGIVAALIMFSLGMLWLERRAKKAKAAGEGYGEKDVPDNTQVDKTRIPSFPRAVISIILIPVTFLILSRVILPMLETPQDVIGMWSLIIALVIAILTTSLLYARTFKCWAELIKTMDEGAADSLLPIFNTASVVGFGKVIAALPVFAIISNSLIEISPNAIIATALSTTVLAGLTGSASGGMAIVLGIFGDKFYDWAIQDGINPAVLHRVSSIASGGLATLPHNGAIITLLSITRLTHKKSYFDIMVANIFIPIIALFVVLILAHSGIV
ncbi:MAG: GntP family permease [Candidatus Methanoperedenaceae archaeon]|nr:GntP family permease [Candidatus Methanoperedenaceae archaeon]